MAWNGQFETWIAFFLPQALNYTHLPFNDFQCGRKLPFRIHSFYQTVFFVYLVLILRKYQSCSSCKINAVVFIYSLFIVESTTLFHFTNECSRDSSSENVPILNIHSPSFATVCVTGENDFIWIGGSSVINFNINSNCNHNCFEIREILIGSDFIFHSFNNQNSMILKVQLTFHHSSWHSAFYCVFRYDSLSVFILTFMRLPTEKLYHIISICRWNSFFRFCKLLLSDPHSRGKIHFTRDKHIFYDLIALFIDAVYLNLWQINPLVVEIFPR